MKKLDKSKLVMSLGKKYKLAPYLDKAIKEFEEPWEYKYTPKLPDDAWHPSGDCLPSAAELYAKATQDRESTFNADGGLNKIFQVGHFWHQYLQHIVLNKLEFCGPEDIERKGERVWETEKTDRWVDKNVQMMSYRTIPTSYHWATGSGDIAPCVLPRGWEGVVDFKTMGSSQFKPTAMPAWCAPKYEAQINMYMDFFDLEHGLILAINKDSGEFKEWEFVRNQPLIDAVYAKWEFVSDCIREGHVPEDHPEDPLPIIGPYEGS